MKSLRMMLVAAVMLGSMSGCVTTASMYVEKDMNPMSDFDYVPGVARAESDMKARIQIDMKKQWQ